jgi:heme A synthase
MLFAGIIAGPLYVLVSLIEVVSRDGFDPRRHAWSQLANGDFGWIHSTTLIVSGLLVMLGALGWRRALRSRAWIFLSGYGLGMVVAGLFPADAGNGFPPGSPATSQISASGLVHFGAGAVGFCCLVVACFLVARRLLPRFSRLTGVVFGLGFLALVAGAGQAWSLVTFTAAVILASAWITTVSMLSRPAAENPRIETLKRGAE